jgi:hypothetical protein
MTLVALSASAQYPTTKTIKGTEVVIMTVPQAQSIDNKFVQMKDSISLLNKSLFINKENLKITNDRLFKTNTDLTKSQSELKQSLLLNETYLQEIERYKKMEFEDKQVKKRVTIGVVSALVVWIAVFIGGISQ